MAKNAVKTKIINTLNVFRARERVTQEQLAKEVGVTRATIIAIERGDYNPSLDLAFRLARYFGADINEIFKIKETDK